MAFPLSIRMGRGLKSWLQPRGVSKLLTNQETKRKVVDGNMIDKWKAKEDNRPYETPKCPLSLSALQPYEVKEPLEISN
jgi:hypothetical protein